MSDSGPIRLSEFILQNLESILQEWEDFARSRMPASDDMDVVALRNHAVHMLRDIAADLGQTQSKQQQSEKSKGNAPRSSADSSAETHAIARVASGFTIEQLVAEYRALRASVLRLWVERAPDSYAENAQDVLRFNEAIDQALTESVNRYAKLVRQSQDMFLAILGHDLRNPLATIMIGANLIDQVKGVPEQIVWVGRRVRESANRMKKLIDDLLDFSRSHLGAGLPVTPTTVNVADACAKIVDELRLAHPERVINIETAGIVEAKCDSDRIEQVFSNLIGNAVKYGRAGEPISISLNEHPNHVTATVTNQGEPIDARKIETIFDPLVRLKDRKVVDGGKDMSLGLGLFITREIIHAHDGTIKVESNVDSGTSFIICLPKSLT